jgi:hypothetical protein
METWALPPAAAARLAALERDLGEERVAGPDGALVRGGHWRHFLVKYPEANRMHKKMLALSALCRERGDPPAARRAIGRAQCNDAYWHGVFGGLYLPHLRAAIWRNLSDAEGALRRGEPLAVEQLDLDCDGQVEVWIHSAAFSAVVSPTRGGVIEEYTLFESGVNYGDVLTRRSEVYHAVSAEEAKAAASSDSAPSIHDLERSSRLQQLPPVDQVNRALFVDRVVAGDGTHELTSWATAAFDVSVTTTATAVELVLRAGSLEKRMSFTPNGELTVSYRWDPSAFPPDAFFSTEISVSRKLALDVPPVSFATVSRSERGFEETVQGYSYTPRWPARVGEARVRLQTVGKD